MRLTFVLWALALAASLVSGSAWSRVPVGSKPHLAPGYAKCLFSRHPDFVNKWLKMLPGTDQEQSLLKQNQDSIDSCFGINSDGSRYFATYDYEGIRAGIIRNLLQSYRDDLTQQPPVGLSNSKWFSNSDVSVPTSAAAALANEMAFCITRTNWGAVRAIVFAVDAKLERRAYLPKSVEERELRAVNAAIDRIIPSVSACLPVGIKLTLDRRKLRRLLEETAFHAINRYSLPSAGTFSGTVAAHA